MEHPLRIEFSRIASRIVGQASSIDQWVPVESDDMFQDGPYDGGFDATELAFTFSYYDEDETEWWFQLTLDEVAEVAAGIRRTVTMRLAET